MDAFFIAMIIKRAAGKKQVSVFIGTASSLDANMKIFIFLSVLVALVHGQGNPWCDRQSLREAFDTAFDLNVKSPSISTSRGSSRIVGGQNAARGQFGFFVLLESFDGRWLTPCGGALIRYNWVLTVGKF